jgi:glycosyltransferase involved in cell wall biosynthesis
VITVPGLGIGGAEKVAVNLAVSLQRIAPDQRILILETDFSGEKLDLSNHPMIKVLDISKNLSELNESEQVRFLYALFSSLRAERIVNVNSSLAWRVFDAHIELLQSYATCGAALFCEDFDLNGNDLGYANRYFSSLAGRIDFFLSDNSSFVSRLSRIFGIEPGKTRTLILRQPAQLDFLKSADRVPFRVAWAGRVVYQKNPDLALEIARGLPDHDFHFFGGPVTNFPLPIPSNVVLHGRYKSFAEVALIGPSVFLYTSRFDGIPNVLIEAGAFRIPIVSSDVGSISELLGTEGERGLIVTNSESSLDFIRAIKDLDEPTSKELVSRMYEYLVLHHSEDAFDNSLRDFFFRK